MAAPTLEQLEAQWNFDAPKETEDRFRALKQQILQSVNQNVQLALTNAEYLELLTQIARAQGLQRQFDQAHETLDQVLAVLMSKANARDHDRHFIPPTLSRVNVRYLLERGRVFNSSKQKEAALPLFVAAWEVAKQCDGEDNLAVDAAHMVAIAEPKTDQQIEWNEKAIHLAEQSNDPKARKWLGSLTNNLGWTYHDAKKFDQALRMFEKALAFRQEAGVLKNLLIAKWCVARCLRSLNRIDEALELQETIREEHAKHGIEPDGYNFEELGELLLLKGEKDQACANFKRAVELLSADPWFVDNEKDRLQRLHELATDVTP